MEELLIKWFGDLTILVIPLFAGIVSSFIVEAINQSTPEFVTGKSITAILCLLIGVGLVFGFPNVVTTLFDKILVVLMNWAFAVLFYHLGGKLINTGHTIPSNFGIKYNYDILGVLRPQGSGYDIGAFEKQ